MTLVLPHPGGPCTVVTACCRLSRTASLCASFRSAQPFGVTVPLGTSTRRACPPRRSPISRDNNARGANAGSLSTSRSAVCARSYATPFHDGCTAKPSAASSFGALFNSTAASKPRPLNCARFTTPCTHHEPSSPVPTLMRSTCSPSRRASVVFKTAIRPPPTVRSQRTVTLFCRFSAVSF